MKKIIMLLTAIFLFSSCMDSHYGLSSTSDALSQICTTNNCETDYCSLLETETSYNCALRQDLALLEVCFKIPKKPMIPPSHQKIIDLRQKNLYLLGAAASSHHIERQLDTAMGTEQHTNKKTQSAIGRVSSSVVSCDYIKYVFEEMDCKIPGTENVQLMDFASAFKTCYKHTNNCEYGLSETEIIAMLQQCKEGSITYFDMACEEEEENKEEEEEELACSCLVQEKVDQAIPCERFVNAFNAIDVASLRPLASRDGYCELPHILHALDNFREKSNYCSCKEFEINYSLFRMIAGIAYDHLRLSCLRAVPYAIKEDLIHTFVNCNDDTLATIIHDLSDQFVLDLLCNNTYCTNEEEYEPAS